MAPLKLFDNDDTPSNEIEIDHAFAKRLEHNKKREELQRYEELKKQGRVDSSDSDDSSSEEEVDPTKLVDSRFFTALNKVKNQDPILRNKDAKLFSSDSEDDEGFDDDKNGKEEKDKDKDKRKKPMPLKDVVAKQLIEEGPEFDDEETDGESRDGMKTYTEEQEEYRRDFLKAVEEGEGNEEEDGELFRVKSGGGVEEDEEEVKELEDFFGPNEGLDEDTRFLKDYFRNRMWVDDGRGKGDGDGEIEFSEDEEEVERQEDYEREFNFRYEENAGDRVMGHSRKVEGSVRKKDNARKLQRERKEERMRLAEFERKEELKRMKNLKKKEIQEKLEKIREAAGVGKDRGIGLGKDDLEDEFDPEEHDRKMKETFGNQYYEAEDVDPDFGSDEDLEKPDFDKEDELLGLPKGWDEVNESGDGDEFGDDVDDGGDKPKEGKQKGKEKLSEAEKAAKEEWMEEYCKLDYEDTIGDLKTRFRYRQVKPRRYGLKTADILMLDDKDLNQLVSLKKMAPYREQEWKVPRIKTLNFLKTVLQSRKTNHNSKTARPLNKNKKKIQYEPKTTTEEDKVEETERLQHAESNGELGTSSKRGKRKRQQVELKLSDSRLKAYGKVPTKSKRAKT